MRRDVYNGHLKLHGKDRPETLVAANNFAASLLEQRNFNEIVEQSALWLLISDSRNECARRVHTLQHFSKKRLTIKAAYCLPEASLLRMFVLTW